MAAQSSTPAFTTPAPSGEIVVNRLVWLVGLSHATNHFTMLIFPAVLLLVQSEFGLGYAGLGILASANFLCYGLGALPAGMLADRFGGERILAIWLLGSAIACGGIGFSSGPWTLAAGLALLGLFASLHHPAGSEVLVALRPRLGTNVGRAFGLSGILQGFSTFLPAHLAGHAGIAAITAAQVRRGGAFASLALLFGGLGHLAAGRLMGFRHREALFLMTVTASTLCLFGMGVTSGALLVLFSILLSFTFFALGTISNTFVALHTPPQLGGTVFGVTFSLAFGFGSLASSTMGVVGEQFGLPAVFVGLGMVSALGMTMVACFGGATSGWPRLRTRRSVAD